MCPLKHQVRLSLFSRLCSRTLLTLGLVSLSGGAVYALVAPTSIKRIEEPPKKEGRVLKGIVLDHDHLPLAGATVRVKELRRGVTTNVKGEFTHTFPDSRPYTLIISFVGMESQTVKYTGQKTLKVVLREDRQSLDEVLVMGYNTIKKSSFTGVVTTVTQKDLMKTNNKNVIKALEVFDPSFRLKDNLNFGSDPNSLPEFNIRGESSIAQRKGLDVEAERRAQRTNLKDNPNLPIFILDGFEVSVQKVYDMDMNRIESINILKDAAATALYGSRAANGVVVITSIPPKPGELRVNYNVTAELEFPDLSYYNLANAAQKLEIERISGIYDAKGEKATQAEKDRLYNNLMNEVRRGVNTDWLARPLRNAYNLRNYVSLSGGVESIRYNLDVNYDTNNGAMKGSYRNRMGAGMTLDYRLKDKLQIMNRVSFDRTNMEDSPFGAFGQYSRYQPYNAIYDDKGEYLMKLSYPERLNPLWKEQHLASFSGRGYINDLTNNLSINYYFTPSFYVKGQLSVTKTDGVTEGFDDPKDPMFATSPNTERGRLTRNTTSAMNWNMNTLVYFNKTLGKHFVNSTMGVNLMERSLETGATTYHGFQLGNLNSPSYAAGQTGKTSVSPTKTRLVGLLGSINYAFDDTYLIDGSIRMDGSSQFGRERRFAPFWSIGGGINIHKMHWFPKNRIINTFRLRGTYGSTGKINFSPYAAITTYKNHPDHWHYTGSSVSLIALGNPLLTWEKTNTSDMGFVLELLNRRVYLEASFYNKVTNDLIDEVSIRTSSGFTKYNSNTGAIQNKGFEIKTNLTAYQNRDWSVVFNANIASNTNRITKLGKEMEEYNKQVKEFYNQRTQDAGEYSFLLSMPMTQYYIGASTTAIYAVPSLGIDPSTGKEFFLKKNGTPTFEWTPDDQVVVGDANPKLQGSFGLNIGWRGIYLNGSFLYAWGGQVYNETLLNKVENANISEENVDMRVLSERWIKVGDLVPFFDIRNKDRLIRPTSRLVQDNNYLVFNSLSLGYDFPIKIVKKLSLSSLGVSLNANELGRWASIRTERGLQYPFAHTYSLSLRASF